MHKDDADERRPIVTESKKLHLNEEHEDSVGLSRHITLRYAVMILMGNVIGSGIFLSPRGVTANVGSVGGSLLIWTVTGFYTLAQALCYAELGTLIPRAGGDYTYVHDILGPLPGFMLFWVNLLATAVGGAVIARTAGLYLLEPQGLDCHLCLVTVVAISIIGALGILNVYSSEWTTKAIVFFTCSKLLALIIIIVAGTVRLIQGHTEHFQNAFNETTNDVGMVVLAVLDGYFPYQGWEVINSLPEDMVNPTRDLPLTVWISLISITVIYVFTNVAYFTVLSPAELAMSDTVAMVFADNSLGFIGRVMPVAVALSCMGTMTGNILSISRYLLAGGRYHQVPRVVSFINIKMGTPVIAIVLPCILFLVFCVMTDLQELEEYTSLAIQIKVLLSFVALFYLRYKEPTLHRPIKMHTVLAVVTFLLAITLLCLSVYQNPLSMGSALLLLGLPLYGLVIIFNQSVHVFYLSNKYTTQLQLLFQLAPETYPLKKELT